MTANVSKAKRKQVYRRDGFRCALCDSTRYIQIHHIVPRGSGGPVGNTQNMITLCADCHALAHGTDLRGLGANPDDVTQAIVEYMADLYAESGIAWNPWTPDGKPARIATLAEDPAESRWAPLAEDPATENRFGPP